MKQIMEWINKEIGKTEQIWPLILGIIAILEVVNIGVIARYTSFWVPLAISSVILLIASYYCSILFQSIQRNNKHFMLEKSDAHEKNMMMKLNKMEESILSFSKSYFDAISVSLKDSENKMHEEMLISSEKILEKVNQETQELATLVTEKNKNIANQILITTDLVETKIDTMYQNLQKDKTDLVNEINITNKEISDTLTEQYASTKELITSNNNDLITLLNNNGHQIRLNQELLQSINSEIEKILSEINEKVSKRIIESYNALKEDQEKSIAEGTKLLERNVSLLKQEINATNNNIHSASENQAKEIAKVFEAIRVLTDKEEFKFNNVISAINKANTNDSKITLATEDLVSHLDLIKTQIDNLDSKVSSVISLANTLKSLQTKAELPENILVDEKVTGNDKIEKMIDEENKLSIINKYIGDILSYSEMLQDGKLIFSANYDDTGVMVASKNYDADSNVITEMVYFPNGEVKERKENIKKNGEIVTYVTKFNEKGVKIS